MKREEVVQVLAFAEKKFREELDLNHCAHSGRFQPEDHECTTCEQSIECEWLAENGDQQAVAEKTAEQLVDSLELAMVSIHSNVVGHQSNRWSCQCPSCCWLDDAEKVYKEIRS